MGGGGGLREGGVNKVHCGLCENGEFSPLPSSPPYDTKKPSLKTTLLYWNMSMYTHPILCQL